MLWRSCGCVGITFNSYNRFAALFQQTSSGLLVRPSKENRSLFTPFTWNLQSDPETNEIGLFGGVLLSKWQKKVYEEHLRGETGQPYLAVFFTRRKRLYNQKSPVIWNYMDFISALPSGSYYLSNWWTRHTHTHTQLQPVEGEEYTLHSSCVYSLHRPGRMCSESNFKYDHFATKNTNWGAVIAAPADLNNAQLCHWILVAGSHSEERRPKGQACRLFLGHLKVESQGAWWCMTHRAFWPRSGDSDSLISVKNELHPKNLHFWSICVNIYKKRPDWWEKFVNYRNVKLI